MKNNDNKSACETSKYFSTKVFQYLLIIALVSAAKVVLAADPVTLHILQYHHVDTKTPPSTSTSPLLFEQHLIHLETEGYKVVLLSEALKKLARGEKLEEKSVAITFDDGFNSVYENALPIIRPHGYPFTVFINPDYLDIKSTEHISWEQAKELADSGAEFANHTIGHIHMIELQPGETEDSWRNRVTGAVLQAEERIKEQLGQSHKLLAFPYGEFDSKTKKLVKDLGFFGLGQQSGPVGPSTDWQAIPRFPLPDGFGQMDSFREKLNTLPMYADQISPDTPTIGEENPPALSFQTNTVSLLRINCYASGQGRIQTTVEGNRIQVVGNEAFKDRRFRYNCTAGAGKGKFFWHSFPWINPNVPES